MKLGMVPCFMRAKMLHHCKFWERLHHMKKMQLALAWWLIPMSHANPTHGSESKRVGERCILLQKGDVEQMHLIIQGIHGSCGQSPRKMRGNLFSLMASEPWMPMSLNASRQRKKLSALSFTEQELWKCQVDNWSRHLSLSSSTHHRLTQLIKCQDRLAHSKMPWNNQCQPKALCSAASFIVLHWLLQFGHVAPLAQMNPTVCTPPEKWASTYNLTFLCSG